MSGMNTKTFWVNGIVSSRDNQPYLQLSNEDAIFAQLSLGQARKIGMDMLVMSARTEMDAMVMDFFTGELKLPAEGAARMMQAFREYRAKVDQERVEGSSDGR